MMQVDDTIKLVGGIAGILVTVVGGGLGTWYLKILAARDKLKRLDQEAEINNRASKLAQEKQNRNDLSDEAWKLIERLQKIIDENSADIADIKKEHNTAVEAIKAEARRAMQECEERDRRSMDRATVLGNQYVRAIEYIRMVAQYATNVKGWRMPAFKEEPIDLSSEHTPLPPTKEI